MTSPTSASSPLGVAMAGASGRKREGEFVLANGLVLAEFDIDKGACVRTYYPKASSLSAGGARRKPFGVNVPAQSEYFANHMLPDGAEKLSIARTIFVVNRPRPQVYTRFAAHVFFLSEQGTWQRTGARAETIVSDVLMLDMSTAALSVRFKDEMLVRAFPTTDSSIMRLPTLPPEVASFAQRIVGTSAPESLTPSAQQPSSHAPQGPPPPAAGAAGATATTAGFAFLMAQGEGTHPLGVLLSVGQRERFMAALAKALAPPTPPPEPLYASEEEAPHPVGESATEEKEEEKGEGGEDAGGEGTPQSLAPDAAEEGAPATAEPTTADGESAAAAVSATTTTHVDPEAAATTAPPNGGATPHSGTTLAGKCAGLPTVAPLFSMVGPSSSCTSYGAASVSAATSPASRSTATTTAAEENTGEILYGLCAVVSKRDSTARRGGRTKAVALLGPSLAWLEPFFPMLVEAAQYCCDIPGSDADAVQQQAKVLKLCYDAVNAAAPMVAAGMAKTSQLATEISRYSTLSGAQESYVTYHTAPFGTTLKTRIPLTPSSHDITFNRYSLEGLIEAMGPLFLHLVKGILTEKKIIVLSRMGLSTDVAEAAMALGTLGNLLEPTFIAEKVFPYTSINSVDHFMSLPGYIIGTLNPIFENERVWHWDVLCDLDKKTVVLGEKETGFPSVSGGSGGSSSSSGGGGGIGSGGGRKSGIASSVSAAVNTLSFGSSALLGGGGGSGGGASSGNGGGGSGGGSSSATDADGMPAQTAQFFRDLVNMIYHMRALRIPAAERNRRLRLTLEEFMHTAVMVTYAQGHPDVHMPIAALKEHFMNPVLSSLRAQCRLTSLMDDVRTNVLFPGESPGLILYAAALRRVKGLDSASVLGLLQSMQKLLTDDGQVRLLIRRMTVAVGGVNPILMQLTHPSQAVRAAALRILARIDKLSEGKAAVAAANGFLILVYQDCCNRGLVTA